MEQRTQHELEQAFLDAFSAYGDAIFRFCLMKVSNAALAEDMTQETFMRYWQSLRAGKEMTNTRSLLYTIANNLAKDWYKRKKAESLDDRMDTGYEPRANEHSPEEHAMYREAILSMKELGEHDREVLLLSYVEGFEPKEIAQLLGGSANQISVRLNRAMKRLQKLLHVYET